MKTAVEWIIEKILKSNVEKALFQDEINQAKEMELEQRKEGFRAGWHGNKHKDWNCEFYLEKYISNDFKIK